MSPTVAPSKPSSFLRSSERKVTDPHEAFVIRADRRREKERDAFESLSYGIGRGMVAAGVVEPLDLSDSWERRVAAMQAEDAGNGYDRDGMVR